MKKLKLICSAIAAFGLLALAGCDLELDDSAKVLYKDSVTFDTGVAVADDWSDSLVVGFSPMYGTFTYSLYNGGTAELEDATVTGADAWWTGRVDSSSVSLADGETVTVKLSCTSGTTVAFCIHVHNNTGWWWYNPGDGNFWGDDSLNATYNKTYTMSGTRTLTTDVPFTFTITREGKNLSWSMVTVGSSSEEDEEDD